MVSKKDLKSVTEVSATRRAAKEFGNRIAIVQQIPKNLRESFDYVKPQIIGEFGTRPEDFYTKWVGTTYKELDYFSDYFASGLTKLGIEKNDRVGLLGNNTPEWDIANCGIQKAAGIPVQLFPLESPDTIYYDLENSGSKVLIADKANFKEAAEKNVNYLDLPAMEKLIEIEEMPLGLKTGPLMSGKWVGLEERKLEDKGKYSHMF